MILADFGTSYAKIFKNGKLSIMPVREVKIHADFACGHNTVGRTKNVVNEIVALAKGASKRIRKKDFVCVDVGSRDVKYVRFAGGKYVDSNLNYMCGAMAGFSIELLQKYFSINPKMKFKKAETEVPFTCAVLGIAGVFDEISRGVSYKDAYGMYIKGIVNNIYNFIGRPKEVYLSGGLCGNDLFVSSFPSRVIPLGRFVLIEGLKELV